MDRFLLDTNVVSEARKGGRADPGVRTWLASVRGSQLYLSVLVVGEIRQGVERLQRRDPAQSRVFESWLETLEHTYGDRMVPITADIADHWGRLNVPDPLPDIDGLMAATAQARRMVLVTRNAVDVERTGVEVLNPFSS
ncbi:MAG: type II toxin-antitoxin system VapC family toxin [Acidimicrobiales bacterium]|jgi:predicted nucleic acid-binding protein